MDPAQGSNGAVGTGGGRTGAPATGAGHVQRFVPSCEPNPLPPQKSGSPMPHWGRRWILAINYLGEELGEGISHPF
jgi:hypothetical protein